MLSCLEIARKDGNWSGCIKQQFSDSNKWLQASSDAVMIAQLPESCAINRGKREGKPEECIHRHLGLLFIFSPSHELPGIPLNIPRYP